MAWQMLIRRCPNRSMTVVGDIAQTSADWGAPSWASVFDVIAPSRWRSAELSVNYRTPVMMDLAADAYCAPSTRPRSRSIGAPETGVAPVAVRADRAPPRRRWRRPPAPRWKRPGGGTVGVTSFRRCCSTEVRSAVRGRLPAGTSGEPLREPRCRSSPSPQPRAQVRAWCSPSGQGCVARGSHGLRGLYVALTRATQPLTVLCTPPALPASSPASG